MPMIGLKAPEEICERLSKISVPGKKTPADEMHITMFYFEQDLGIKDILKITQAMYEVTKKADALSIKGNTVSTFNKGDDGVPVIVPIVSDDLVDLRKKMAKKFDNEGIKYSKKWPEYKPHLTLSYSPKEMEDKKLEKSIGWKASEVIFWAGSWHSDPGVLVSMPLHLGKKASKFDKNYLVAELFESLTRLG